MIELQRSAPQWRGASFLVRHDQCAWNSCGCVYM